VLDARKCISYLTIEHDGEIVPELREAMGELIFGCDICQEVCPYNQAFAKPLSLQAFKEVKIAGSSLDLQEILAIESDEVYLQKFAGSPLMRPKRKNLQRNAQIAFKNTL
jgi:epoxyqueuosine reductase